MPLRLTPAPSPARRGMNAVPRLSALFLALAIAACDTGPTPPAAEVLDTFETGAPRPEVLVALPVGPGIGDENRLVVGYERDRYRIEGVGVEVLWVRRAGLDGELHDLGRENLSPVVFRDDHLDGWGWRHFDRRRDDWGLADRSLPPEITAPQWPEELRFPPDTVTGGEASPPEGDSNAGGSGGEAPLPDAGNLGRAEIGVST